MRNKGLRVLSLDELKTTYAVWRREDEHADPAQSAAQLPDVELEESKAA